MKDYKLGALLLLLVGLLCIIIGVLLGSAVGTNAFKDANFSATMLELAGLLVGGGLIFSICSPIITIANWYLDKESSASLENHPTKGEKQE
jgi:hypothetical protein